MNKKSRRSSNETQLVQIRPDTIEIKASPVATEAPGYKVVTLNAFINFLHDVMAIIQTYQRLLFKNERPSSDRPSALALEEFTKALFLQRL